MKKTLGLALCAGFFLSAEPAVSEEQREAFPKEKAAAEQFFTAKFQEYLSSTNRSEDVQRMMIAYHLENFAKSGIDPESDARLLEKFLSVRGACMKAAVESHKRKKSDLDLDTITEEAEIIMKYSKNLRKNEQTLAFFKEAQAHVDYAADFYKKMEEKERGDMFSGSNRIAWVSGKLKNAERIGQEIRKSGEEITILKTYADEYGKSLAELDKSMLKKDTFSAVYWLMKSSQALNALKGKDKTEFRYLFPAFDRKVREGVALLKEARKDKGSLYNPNEWKTFYDDNYRPMFSEYSAMTGKK